MEKKKLESLIERGLVAGVYVAKDTDDDKEEDIGNGAGFSAALPILEGESGLLREVVHPNLKALEVNDVLEVKDNETKSTCDPSPCGDAMEVMNEEANGLPILKDIMLLAEKSEDALVEEVMSFCDDQSVCEEVVQVESLCDDRSDDIVFFDNLLSKIGDGVSFSSSFDTVTDLPKDGDSCADASNVFKGFACLFAGMYAFQCLLKAAFDACNDLMGVSKVLECGVALLARIKGVAAKNILAVTFSRRAGQDLLFRLHTAAASQAVSDNNVSLEGIRVSTFHSFCLSILRAFPTYAGLPSNFIVVTPKMQLQLLEDLVRVWYEEKHALTEVRNAKTNSQVMYGPLAEPIKQSGFHAEAMKLYQQLRKFESSRKSGSFLGDQKSDLDRSDELFNWIYERYQSAVRKMNGIDFNDFPRLACKVLEDCEAAFTATGLQAQYILVDEFQDTDLDQFQLLRLLCRDHKRLTIIGDDDQQIYTWRGAAGFHNLMMFENFFHGATVTKLEQNFRSTGAIVAAARSVIAKNLNRTTKTIRTLSPTGTTLSVCECRNEQCEASAVAKFILALKEQSIPFREIAVLYRLQHVGLELRDMLQARGIPCSSRCHVSGHGENFLGVPGGPRSINTVGAVLHDIMATLRLMLSEADDFSCREVMEALCPTFFSSNIYKCAEHLQRQEGIPLYKALMSARSHLLGLKKHEGLASCGFERLHQADEHVAEGLHLLRQILETAGADVKSLGMKDVIMNLLQQISPFRTRKHEVPMSKGNNVWHDKLISQQYEGRNLEFAGIKALLNEASKFDMEWENEEQKIGNQVVKSSGYKTLLQKKTARHSLRESYKLESKHSEKLINGSSKRLQSFIDHVSLKLHDGELGDCEYCSTPLKKDAGDECEPEPQDSVVLSTVHQAKGLEWTAVILIRTNEGIIPLMDNEPPSERVIPQALDTGFHIKSNRGVTDGKSVSNGDIQDGQTTSNLSDGSIAGGVIVLRDMSNLNVVQKCRDSVWKSIEEERRLMYVALTRAKRFLLVTYVMLQGHQVMLPSRFLADIPKGLMCRTTCYDAKGEGMNGDASRKDVGGRSSDLYGPPKASNKGSFNKKALFNTVVKGGPLPHGSKINKKGELHHPKLVSMEAVDVTQSLKEIDDLLDGSVEPALCRKVDYSSREKGVKGEFNFKASNSFKRRRHRPRQVVDSSSDDSDFETASKLTCKRRA
ncbi:hypothetical protein L7F22_006758 [Adiantum nelumboides]|nr:hypothetical protein [Adiantum nelumboides]